VGYYSNAKDMLQLVSSVILVSVYLKLTCSDVIVHKTIAIRSRSPHPTPNTLK